MRVWAVANQKGGVGKTTSVVSLGGLLAGGGKRVLLLDLDPHGSLTSYFNYNPDDVRQSVYQLFDEDQSQIENLLPQLILDTGQPGLDLIPASTSLATLERKAIHRHGAGLVIAKSLTLLWDDYDYVIMDTPPVLGVLLINALAACQYILLPVQTEFLALKGLERMLHTLTMVMASQKRQLPYLVVPTMFDRRTQASVSSLRELRNSYQDVIWPSAIPVDTRFRDASQAGKPIHLYDATTRGVVAYQSLLNFLLQAQQLGYQSSNSRSA